MPWKSLATLWVKMLTTRAKLHLSMIINVAITCGLSLAISQCRNRLWVSHKDSYVATSDIVKNLMHQVITCSTCLPITYTLLVAMY